MATLNISELAQELYDAHISGQAVESRPTSRDENFELPAAYAVVGELVRLTRAGGWKTTGRKIGFTNKAVWPRLGLDTIVWGYVFDATVRYAKNNEIEYSLARTVAPRIEPEIVFKLKAPLTDTGDPKKVLEAVEWFALGYEIVDCPYPNWRFRPADMVAAFGFHSGLVIGEPQPLGDLARVAEALPNIKLRLSKNGEVVAEGVGSNVFDSPALCLGQLAETVKGADPLAAGEVVTSGTITDAQPIAPGETWTAELEGLPLPKLTIKFTS